MIEVKEFTGGVNGLPQFQDRKQMWETLSFGLVEDEYPQTQAYINALREVFDNGAVEFRAFSVPEHEVFDWYASRNQFHEMGFFKEFWSSPTVKQEFPYQLNDYNFFSHDLFDWSSPFLFGGLLAWALSSGGAYHRHPLGPVDAKMKGDAVARELVGDAYDEVLLFQSHAPWSTFFWDVAWDYTWIVINKEHRHIYVIIATDTD